VQNVSFTVRRGEIFGIGGMVGSGRTELLNLIFGVDKADRGCVFIDGEKVTASSPQAAIAQGIALITENRKELGLFLPRPVRENMAIVDSEQSGGVLHLQRETAAALSLADLLHIRMASPEQEVEGLSGGNQQKALLGRWLLGGYKLFLFDEPTKGVDIGAKEEIYRQMTELARQGNAIVMVSSDMPELLSLSDRIGVMRGGRMVKIVEGAAATEEMLVKEFLGLDDAEAIHSGQEKSEAEERVAGRNLLRNDDTARSDR
jgi:ribose transport system ATP-binding protein